MRRGAIMLFHESKDTDLLDFIKDHDIMFDLCENITCPFSKSGIVYNIPSFHIMPDFQFVFHIISLKCALLWK